MFHSICAKIPAARKGPKANLLSRPFSFPGRLWTSTPAAAPVQKAHRIFSHPRKSPAAAISFTSPPPTPFPPVNKKTRYKRLLTAKKPAAYSYHRPGRHNA